MSATESTAHMSAAASVARKRVGGQPPGESGSDSENDHALAQHWIYFSGAQHWTYVDATASGGECFVAANLLRRNLGCRRLDVVSPRRPFAGTGAHCYWGSGSLVRRA
jgi:hypothetical protein